MVSLVGILMVSSAVAQAPGAPPEAGKLGDEHEHASMLVRILATSLISLLIHIKSKAAGSILKSGMVIQFIDIRQG